MFSPSYVIAIQKVINKKDYDVLVTFKPLRRTQFFFSEGDVQIERASLRSVKLLDMVSEELVNYLNILFYRKKQGDIKVH